MIDRNSIRSQILRLVLGAVFISVVLALCYAGLEFHDTIQNARVRTAETTARLLAANSTVAVSFGDPDSASEVLKTISVQEAVLGAVILDASGEGFASYGQLDADVKSLEVSGYHRLREQRVEFRGATLYVAVPLVEMDEVIGVLVTVTDTSDIQTTFYSALTNLLLVFGVVISLVTITSIRILNAIVSPIVELTDVARQVSESQDYSLRTTASAVGETGTLCQQFNDMLCQIESSNVQLKLTKEELYHVNESLERRVVDRTKALETANNRLTEEFEEKESAFAELKEVQTQLVESSRAAGMAEIANGVLHNIGNVLNSVKVSASVATSRVTGLKITPLNKTASLLKEKQETMGDSWTEFEGLQHVPNLLDELGKSLKASQHATVEELRGLDQNIQFIEEIVRSQQTHARQPGLKEMLYPSEIMDTSLKLVSSGKDFEGIDIIRDYMARQKVPLDKNRVMQILSNFIKNGFEAMEQTSPEKLCLNLSVTQPTDEIIRFSVRDFGHGIPPQTLSKLFTYGFTTKPTGHGFGLHSAACSAREMGGEVKIESDGRDQGACFSLDLPVSPVDNAAATEA